MTMRLATRLLLLPPLLLVPSACDMPRDEAPHETIVSTVDPHPPAPPSSMAPSPPSSADALDEASSVGVLGTLNAGEIDLARYALEHARSGAVRDLAQQMIDQHTDAQTRVGAWAASAQVTERESDVSRYLETGAREVRTRLEATAADAFDRAYVQSQIDMHTEALELLDQRILPGAHDEAFRTLATSIRASIAEHLGHARTALGTLES